MSANQFKWLYYLFTQSLLTSSQMDLLLQYQVEDRCNRQAEMQAELHRRVTEVQQEEVGKRKDNQENQVVP